MTDHDPLCPRNCDCVLIAKARADEREKIAAAVEAHRDDWMPDEPLTREEEAYADGLDAGARIARDGGVQ